jgi:hypothetical protein
LYIKKKVNACNTVITYVSSQIWQQLGIGADDGSDKRHLKLLSYSGVSLRLHKKVQNVPLDRVTYLVHVLTLVTFK